MAGGASVGAVAKGVAQVLVVEHHLFVTIDAQE